MREIKFRAKYFDEWYFGTIVTRKVKDKGRMRNIYILMGLDNENWIPLREDQYDTIGQFTDLRDKNEKEIYEGDIVRYVKGQVKGDNGEWEDDVVVFVVKYEEASFTISYYARVTGSLEVIGNIYDNPELLKGGK